MANSNTEHSIALRQKTSMEWRRERKIKGELITLQIDLTGKENVLAFKSLKIKPTEFIKQALKLLNEHGEIRCLKD